MKKYMVMALPLMAGIEIVSLAALLIITIMALCDIARAAEKRGA